MITQKLLLTIVFIITFIISIMLSLPLSWVLQQEQVKQQIPNNIILQKPQGTWWNGQANIIIKTPHETIDIGNIQWQLNWHKLLLAQISSNINWYFANTAISSTIIYNRKYIVIAETNGSVPIKDLMSLSNKTAILADAEGTVNITNLSLKLPVASRLWPTEINGKISVLNLSALGASIDTLEAIPTIRDQQIHANITGGQPGWQLIANILLAKDNTYKLDIKITANNANNMPSWVSLMLPMQTPQLAQLQQTGRW